jgi:hypothetical protein
MEQLNGSYALYLGPDEDRSGRRAAVFEIPRLFDLTHVFPAIPVHWPQGISRHPPGRRAAGLWIRPRGGTRFRYFSVFGLVQKNSCACPSTTGEEEESAPGERRVISFFELN